MTQALNEKNGPDAEITSEVIDGVFKDIFPLMSMSSFKLPRRESIQALAEFLEQCRQLSQLEPTYKERSKQETDFVNGMALLHKSLPLMLANHSQQPSYSSDLKHARMVATLRYLGNALEDVKNEFFPLWRWDTIPSSSGTVTLFSWEGHVWHLVMGFRKAMASTNVGIEIKLSNGGPISKFLEAVIPLITGEVVKGVTVIRWLHRNPEEG